MTSPLFTAVSTLLLVVIILLSFPLIRGEGSGDAEGFGENQVLLVTTILTTAPSTTLAQNQQQSVCGSRNLSPAVNGSGLLQSPNYPQNYPSRSECWWTITVPVGRHVQVNFSTFDLETGYDFLHLYDAPSQAEAGQSLATVAPKHVTSALPLSTYNYFTLKFKSDGSVERKGFQLTYNAVLIDCASLPTPSMGRKRCYVRKNNKVYCRFGCKKYYERVGSRRRWCHTSGTWTGNQVICSMKSCSVLQAPENGSKRCTNSNYFNSACNFSCNDGHELFGSASRSCDRTSLLWEGYDTSCQGSPPTPTCDVKRLSVCNGYSDCPDSSDEKGCTCPHYKFKCDCYETGCKSLAGCISQSGQCNGKNDCGDWSDERNCQCSDTGFQCKHAACINRSKVSDGNADCVNGDDELICNTTQDHIKCDCMHDDINCKFSGRCIPNSWIGDTVPDCKDHRDEPCNTSQLWCDKCWVTINQCSKNHSKNSFLRKSRDNATRCHRLTVPSEKTKILETSWICVTSSCGKCLDVFQCDSGQIIDNELYCDKTPKCEDGSDEGTKGFGFRCSGRSRKTDCVLPQRNVYDSVAQCADSSDLCFMDGEFRCFSCLDGRLIVSAEQVCDGKVDCYDMSDECLCANQSVCNAVLGKESTRCPSNQMHCYSDTACVNMENVLCNFSVDCSGGNNQRFCHLDQQSRREFLCSAATPTDFYVTVSAVRCDGRPECFKMEDECYCEPRPVFCDGECSWAARINIYGNRVCDGFVNEIGFNSSCNEEVERNCPMRFHCKSKDMISIDRRLVCDGKFDCDDHSDENITECHNKHFYCIKGIAISIDKAFVCDGIDDCDEGEDEDRQLCGESISLFSDQYEMISSSILRALLWIMGLLALIGNLLTNIYTAKNVFCCENNNDVRVANDIFILNLTVSDFLMGVYLIALGSQGSRYSGFYGLVDREWRSSNLCSGLGMLAVLSSEASAFIMAAMSTFRLVTVYKPFLSSSIKPKWIFLAGCSCWILSILLAVIPLFPFDSGYFVSDVLFPSPFFQSDTASTLDMFTLAKHVSSDDVDPKSWFQVKEIISDAFPYNEIKREFGYYGETSVCMPRLYASTNEAAWQYSTFLITLNFLLFICMVVAYLLVYKRASGMRQSRSTKKDPNKGMQKRISRLLLTDFCCWIPVCMLGYLSVAGVSLPPEAYVASAGLLLPINSAMNPILYSQFIGRHSSRAKKWITQNFCCIASSHTVGDNTTRSCDTKANDVELRVIEVKE